MFCIFGGFGVGNVNRKTGLIRGHRAVEKLEKRAAVEAGELGRNERFGDLARSIAAIVVKNYCMSPFSRIERGVEPSSQMTEGVTNSSPLMFGSVG